MVTGLPMSLSCRSNISRLCHSSSALSLSMNSCIQGGGDASVTDRRVQRGTAAGEEVMRGGRNLLYGAQCREFAGNGVDGGGGGVGSSGGIVFSLQSSSNIILVKTRRSR
ncbi:hypothetical protein EYF80_051268 [Liparis tanakae]|uniref:Uncharacterized protein n=1 Tax=Liparis tanakae TaxID=230148 RepID=A0A4Z2FCE1_9TELE|nr:hypothetical protein EYF80_051268 [Liparis tanakae]